MTAHLHPQSDKASVEGRKLKPRETLEASDMYASTDGTWQPCPPSLVGHPLEYSEVAWVRPQQQPDTSSNAAQNFFAFASGAMFS